MRTRQILVRLTEDGVYYNSSQSIAWEQTNFPPKSDFALQERKPVYWLVNMTNFNHEHGILYVTIVDYQAKVNASFNDQKPKLTIQFLQFENLQWSSLQAILRTYIYSSFMHFDHRKETPASDKEQDYLGKHEETHSSQEEQPASTALVVKLEPIIPTSPQSLEFDFNISLNKIHFEMGKATHDRFFVEFDETLSIHVFNDVILPQFNYIKPFFKKYLNRGKINIKGKVLRGQNGEYDIRARSKEIEQISDKMISSIRRTMIYNAFQEPKFFTVDKDLFTADDIVKSEDGVDLGKAMQMDEIDLVGELMKMKGIRNQKQLLYLSGKVQDKSEKIRFTLAPEFGFLFFHQGPERSHFIWELLDSNATYIWSCEQDELMRSSRFKEIERFINFIRSAGRRAYLSSHDQAHFTFSRVTHSKTNSKLIDPFPLWKAKLDERLY